MWQACIRIEKSLVKNLFIKNMKMINCLMKLTEIKLLFNIILIIFPLMSSAGTVSIQSLPRPKLVPNNSLLEKNLKVKFHILI